MRALGLDISTSCTGWCILENVDGVISNVEMGAIKLEKIESTFSKANLVRDHLLTLKSREVEAIFIEENLQSFSSGLSSAQTLVTLARFNGIVSFISEDVLGISPVFINVSSARKQLGLKTVKETICGIPLKEQVFDWVKKDQLQREILVEWPYKNLKSGPRKGEIVLDKSAYDMSDAYVMALAGALAPQ